MMGPVPADAEALTAHARGITLRQPWGWAIAYAGKPIENRAARWSHRGPVLIHAGKGFDVAAMRDPRITDAALALVDRPEVLALANAPSLVLAVANLVDAHTATVRCTLGDCAPWGEPPAPARERRRVAHLVLADVEALDDPVPHAVGALYPWRVPAETAAAVAHALAEQRR